MSGTQAGEIAWTRDFIVIQGELPAAQALARIEETTARWIIIQRQGGLYQYAFRVEEILNSPRLREAREQGVDLHGVTLAALLDLHELDTSTPTDDRAAPAPIDLSWRPSRESPSIHRYIERLSDGELRAIGEKVAVASVLATTRSARGGMMAHTPGLPGLSGDLLGAGRGSPARSGSAAPTDQPAPEDEGTTPVRHPSIEADAPLSPGAAVTFTVDLLRQAAVHTQGSVALGPQPSNWTTLELAVRLSCPAIEFETEGCGTVTIRRNADSLPAPIKGVVRADTPVGTTLAVMAQFFDGTRYCGTALRMFTAAPPTGPAVSAPTAESRTTGTIVAEPAAQRPDLTVYIAKVDQANPGRLRWQVTTHRFDGLPPKLSAEIDLGRDPAREASDLFKEFAQLERGQHRKRIEGFGSELWQRAPQMFRDVYWALRDHYHRRLTIQFISEEPHLPWELMRPVRPDESEIHQPLALDHVRARWIARWDGYMRNQLPNGRIYTIAPRYPTASRRLPRAQSEAQTLIAQFQAQPVDGKLASVTSLLETAPPAEPVAVLHFAGHGKFSVDATSESNIKLEDGVLAASEIGRPEVRLGKACRTLVFFNACEVGASGSVLGEVGGWADAFLGRQFGGFIAPLWSVDDEDAGVVAAELIDGIVKRHEPVGEVLRGVREKHGATSPTFYSYLYYGDVTARVGG